MKKTEVRHREGVTILDLKGKITIGAGDLTLREAVIDALEAGSLHILLDLKEVTKIDSSGIGELVSAYTTVSNRGGKLKLEYVPPKLLKTLQMTELITVLDVYDDEDEAIESF